MAALATSFASSRSFLSQSIELRMFFSSLSRFVASVVRSYRCSLYLFARVESGRLALSMPRTFSSSASLPSRECIASGSYEEARRKPIVFELFLAKRST